MPCRCLTMKRHLLIAAILALLTLAVIVIFTKVASFDIKKLLPGYDVMNSHIQERMSKDGSTFPPVFDGSTSPPVSSKRKKIVYSCTKSGCGGWGDRQKGIVSAYVLSAMLGRDFGISLSFPCDLDLLLTPNKVNWKVTDAELIGDHVKTYQWLDRLGVKMIRKAIRYSSLDDAFPFDVSKMTWNMELVQYLRKHPSASRIEWVNGKTVPEIYYKVLNDLFVIQPKIHKRLTTFRNLIPKGVKLACAQIRLGKHKGFPDSETINSIEHYPVIRQFLTQYNNTDKFRIFLTSDSEAIIQSAAEDFPEVSLTLPGVITHVDAVKSDKACDGFRKAILDQYALSTCDILVISESGLAKIAAFLRGHDNDLYLFYDGEVESFEREDSFPNRQSW